MKIVAKKDRKLLLINTGNTQNENKAETIELTVPEEYEDYNKKIVFVTDDGIVWDIIQDNTYKLTKAITKYKQVDFYIWLTKGDVDFRSKTMPLRFYHNEDASDEITPEEISGVNTVVNILEEEIEKVENLNIEATKIGDTTTVTITKKDGTTESVQINDGVDGQDGQDGQDGYTPQKGIDYFTEQDIEEIETDVKNDLEENVLVNYSLIAETGAKIELSINTTDYKLKAILKDKNNNIIHTSNVIDLPLETMVVNATYDNVNKAIILTLQNGTTVSISVADLVSGLVSESQLQTILSNYYTKTEINNLLNNKVDKVQGKELSSNDFTDTLKEKLEGLENYDDTEIKADISDIQDEQTEQNTDIEKLQTENARLKATLPTTGEVTGETITLNKTAELEFKKPPLPMGNSEQESTNNLLYLDSVRGGFNDIEPTLENGIVHLKGTNDEERNVKGNYRNGYVEMNTTQEWKTNTTYYISCKIEVVSNVKELDTSYFNCFLYGNLNQSITKDNSTGRYIGSTTTPASLTDLDLSRKYVEIRIDGMEVNISEVSLKTVEDYTFDGYGIKPSPEHESPITNVTGDVEVKVQNKNLFDGSKEVNTNFTNSVATALNHFIQTGEYATGYCNNSNQISAYAGVYETCFVPISENTNYHISSQASENNGFSSINILDKNGNLLQSSNNWVGAGYAFTTPSNAKYLMFGTRTVNIDYIQLIKGTTSIPLVPHKEQVFIFPLGNEKLMLGDYLADDGIHHVRRQVVFDGSNDELWGITRETLEKTIQFRLTDCIYNTNVNVVSFLCNRFIHKKWIDAFYPQKDEEYLSQLTSTDVVISINRNRLSNENIPGFKSWLSNNPLIIEYKLEEEAIVPYTSAQQEVYNQIKQAISYEEQTNISSNTIALFNVEAYQSTKLVLEEMATAIVALGGV